MNKKNILNSLKIGLLGVFFILSSTLNATTYYVDATSGSDSQNGTSPSTAWQTLSKVSSSSFAPGDIVSFKRGEVFKGSLSFPSSGNSSNYITIGAYGTGDKPILTNHMHHSLTFSSLGNNRWRANTNLRIFRLTVDGTEVLKAKQSEELGTNVPDPCLWYNESAIGWDLDFYSATNPSSRFFEYSTGTTLVISNKSYIHIRDIEIQGGGFGMTLLSGSSNIHISNIVLGNLTSSGIEMSNVNNILVEDSVFDTHLTFDYSGALSTVKGTSGRGTNDGFTIISNVSNCEFRNNYFKNWGHASMNLTTWGNIGNMDIHHNTLTAPDLTYGGRFEIDGNVHDVEFYYNLVVDTAVVTQINGHNNYFHHNYFDGVRDTPLKAGNQAFGVEFYPYATHHIYNNRVEYNTFLNLDGSAVAFTGTGAASDNIENQIIKNNIIYNCGLEPRYANGSLRNVGIIIEPFSEIKGQIFQNNAISHPTETGVIGYKGARLTVDGFNAQNGNNGNIISGNVNLYPPESSTTYGAGPRENVGAGALIVPSQTEEATTPVEEEPKTGAFVMDPSGLH